MENITDIIRDTLEAIKAKAQSRILSEGRSASGKSAASLAVSVVGGKGYLLGNKSLLSIEHGRGPGRTPYHFHSIIKEWIKAKGISVTPIQEKRNSTLSAYEQGLNSMAGAIAYTIMKRGTKLYRAKGFNDIFTTVVNEELERLLNKVCAHQYGSITIINNKLL